VPSNSSADQTRVSQQSEAWAFRQRGWTQARIAEKLGVNQSTVCRWLDTIERRELARLSKRVESQKVRQTAILELIVDESLQAWDRSKTPRKRASKKTAGGILGKNGQPIDATQTDVQDRDGDPAHLNTAMQAMREARRLWGLDAPTKRETNDDGGSMSVASVVARMKANAAGHDAKGGDDHG
jgi:predicted transcriptional regulator